MSRTLAVPLLTAPCAGMAAAAAHEAYVDATNSIDQAHHTDDVAYQSQGEPEIVGKVAVRTWAAAYFGSTHSHWKKTSLGFAVNGDWAFERYRYESADTDRKAGAETHDAGKGSNVFRRAATVAGAWPSTDRAAGS